MRDRRPQEQRDPHAGRPELAVAQDDAPKLGGRQVLHGHVRMDDDGDVGFGADRRHRSQRQDEREQPQETHALSFPSTSSVSERRHHPRQNVKQICRNHPFVRSLPLMRLRTRPSVLIAA